ncbi:S-adenosyl-L-methionine-dependent methyltransferase [Cyathus striatus]|nr:S-adenosyl-L-methionine-dependent methyltransferase [Cyathus striatus]
MSDQKSIPHTARHHIVHPDTVYILPADEDERTRLNSQHASFKSAFNNTLLLPPIHLHPNDKILDSGTGTGIWLIDLIQSHPTLSLTCTGIDISPLLFPPTPPPNITFAQSSALSLSVKNEYNLINQRLLISSLTRSQWPILLNNLYEALKQGGYIQLAEPGPSTAGPKTEHWKSILSKLCSQRGIWEDIYLFLPSLLQTAGFTQITTHERMVPMDTTAGEEGRRVREDHVAFMRGCKSAVLDAGGFGLVGSESEFEELARDVGREAEVVGACVRWVVVCAQRPLEGEVL